jgi:hypothetical protein
MYAAGASIEVDVDAAGEFEIARIHLPEIRAKIRARQPEKRKLREPPHQVAPELSMVPRIQIDPESPEWRARRRELLYEIELKDWPHDEIMQILKERYSAPVIPPCRVCGAALSLQSNGMPSIWGCTGQETDPDRPEALRYKQGRRFADPHYTQSRYTDYKGGGDEVVIELLRRLLEHEVVLELLGRLETLKAAT